MRDAWVVIFAQDAQRWPTPTRFMPPGAQSEQHPPCSAGGEYFAVALTDVEPGEWNDPDFLGPLRDRATRVTVADGANTTVDLKLSR